MPTYTRTFTKLCPYTGCKLGCFDEANHRARYAHIFCQGSKYRIQRNPKKLKEKEPVDQINETKSDKIDYDKLREISM